MLSTGTGNLIVPLLDSLPESWGFQIQDFYIKIFQNQKLKCVWEDIKIIKKEHFPSDIAQITPYPLGNAQKGRK